MKNKIALVSLLFFLLVFNIINGKYVAFATFTFITFFSFIERQKGKLDKKNILYASLFLIINILLIRYILNNYIIDIKYKNIFSSFYIVFYNYIFCDIDFVIKSYNYIKNKCFLYSKKWRKLISSKKILYIFPKNLWIFILFILSMYTFISFTNKGTNDYYNVFLQPNKDKFIEILKDTKINFEFVDEDISFSTICFPIGTFDRDNDTSLTFYVKNGDKTLYKKKINTNNLKNGQLKCFNIGKTSSTKLKKYNVYFSPDSRTKEGNSVAIFADKKTGNISFSLAVKQAYNVSIAKYLLIFYSFIIFFIINYFINSKKISFEKYYILLTLYIIPILFIFPAFTIPDELHHFYRAYANSQIINDNFKFNGLDNSLTTVPTNMNCLNYSNVQLADKIYDINDIIDCSKEAKNKVITNTSSGINPIFGYITQAIGIKIADTFSNSPLLIFYFGRMFTFMFCLFIVYEAIKITPKYKSLFLFVSTMMMFIQQMISYSYDSILNSISLLFVALVLKLICSENKIKFKDLLLPLICFSIIVNIKAAYFPLGVLIFFIPKEKFKKNKYLYILIFFISYAILFKLINLLISLGIRGNASGIIDHDASKQLSYIIKHPFYILEIALNTIKFNSIFYIRGLIGYFGWFAFKINDIYFVFYLLVLIYILLSEKNIINIKNRIILFISIMISIIIIFGAMYLLWSGYKNPVVDGVQGRYFIPLLMPLFLCFIPKKSKLKLDNTILYSSINIFLLQFILILIVWYF